MGTVNLYFKNYQTIGVHIVYYTFQNTGRLESRVSELKSVKDMSADVKTYRRR